jgi:hypothetical protein
MEEIAVVHMKYFQAEKQVISLWHNNEIKIAQIIPTIQYTKFAVASSTVYSAYMWPANPFTDLSKAHFLQVITHENRQLICYSTLKSSAALL